MSKLNYRNAKEMGPETENLGSQSQKVRTKARNDQMEYRRPEKQELVSIFERIWDRKTSKSKPAESEDKPDNAKPVEPQWQGQWRTLKYL